MVLRMLLDRFRGAWLKLPYVPVVASKYEATGVPGELTLYFVDGVYNLNGKRILITDDVADTGDTTESVKKYYLGLGEVELATLHYKPNSKIIPGYYGDETTAWIIYPWEVKEAIMDIFINYKTTGEIRDQLNSAGIGPDELRSFYANLDESDNLKNLVQQFF